MMSCEDCGLSQEAVRVQDEPEHPLSPGDCYLATPIKEETDNTWHSECLYETEHVKQQALCVESVQQERSCSSASALAGLYTDHTVKDELLLGPEVLHRPNVTQVCCDNRGPRARRLRGRHDGQGTGDQFVINTRDISRTNAYNKEPDCISRIHPHLNPYCYCR